MSETTTETNTPASSTDGTSGAGGSEATAPQPPWGSDDEFNPQRAWDLIQNLRGDVETAKSKAAESDELRGKLREFEDAQLSEQEKAARDLELVRQQHADVSLENARLKAVIEHGLSADDLELVGGSTPEEIAERATKLAARLKEGSGTPKAPPTQRPAEGLRGGGDPTVPVESSDWLRSALSGRN